MGIPRTGISFFGLGAALLTFSAGLAFSQSSDRVPRVDGVENPPGLATPPYPRLRPALASQPASLLDGLDDAGALECTDIDAQFFASCTAAVPAGEVELAVLPAQTSDRGAETGPEPAKAGQAFRFNPPASAPPRPAPFTHRPVLVVYPRDVSLIRPARSISGDPLVHQLAPGSWPRRLDQVNALASAEQYIVAQGGDGSSFVKAWIEARADGEGPLDSK